MNNRLLKRIEAIVRREVSVGTKVTITTPSQSVADYFRKAIGRTDRLTIVIADGRHIFEFKTSTRWWEETYDHLSKMPI